jgi:transglutaminase-like putative cysteine protease
MKKFLTPIFIIISNCAFSAEVKYPVSSISEEMKKGMYAVIRLRDVRFEIKSINSSTNYHHEIITILNQSAKSLAIKIIGYDKFSSIKFFRGIVYDANGKIIKKLKQSEIIDQGRYDGFSLYSDNRLKYADLTQSVYPYTVEFEYQIEEKYLYSPAPFYLYNDDEVSIEQANYTLIYPKLLKPRIKEVAVSQPKVTHTENEDIISWIFNDIIPSKFEPFSQELKKIVPYIIVGPVDFEYDGYSGKMDTWENYGKWQLKLNEGRDVLPELTKAKVRELTASLKTNEEKTKALYEYLQSKTRYVNITLGIGGLQPFPAETVDKVGYGDCKALSNYMVSLLKEAGIKGYYSKIMAGEGASEITPDFVSHQTNHIIVAVPMDSDTVWLECTNQQNPFNYQGRFTGDRKAIMVTENGGFLVNTLHYSAEQNIQSRTAHVSVLANGNAKASVKTTYSGLQYENGNLNFVLDNQYDDQKKWIQSNTDIPSFDINTFSMTNIKNKIPSAIVNLDLTLNRLATVSGKRMFLTPNLMNRSTYIPEKVEDRKTKVVRKLAYIDLDTISYTVPEEIYPEYLPEPVKIKSRFGEYEASYKLDQGKLVYIRRVKMNKGEFPAESYSELIDFYKSLNKADNAKIVFLTKT